MASKEHIPSRSKIRAGAIAFGVFAIFFLGLLAGLVWRSLRNEIVFYNRLEIIAVFLSFGVITYLAFHYSRLSLQLWKQFFEITRDTEGL